MYSSFLPEQFEKLLFLLWNFNSLSSSLNGLGETEGRGGRFENLMSFDGVAFLDMLLVVPILILFLN